MKRGACYFARGSKSPKRSAWSMFAYGNNPSTRLVGSLMTQVSMSAMSAWGVPSFGFQVSIMEAYTAKWSSHRLFAEGRSTSSAY